MDKDDKTEVPDYYDDKLFAGAEGAQGASEQQEEAVLQPIGYKKPLIKQQKRQYKRLMLILYATMGLAQLGIWGTALFGLYLKNVWLVWVCAPYAAGSLFVFANLAVYYIRKNFHERMSIPAFGPSDYVGTLRRDGSIDESAPPPSREDILKSVAEARKATETRLNTCFGNICGLADGKFQRSKVKDCVECQMWLPCNSVTQERVMIMFYKE